MPTNGKAISRIIAIMDGAMNQKKVRWGIS